ncbi:MAG TPA: type II toxin-antitoxin system VapC family toxin [Burkholderiales bacterium]|nr:type II toxin-antitoxin system VapC family toxin [Burkholderiales bacterium]
MAFVLDASVAVAWFVRKQATSYTDRIRSMAKREPLHVPAVWPLEVANALIVLQRRGNISEKAARTAADLLGDLVVTVHQDRLTVPELLVFAAKYRLSAYDVSYLNLALSLRLPLACKDGPLQRTLPGAGVRLA